MKSKPEIVKGLSVRVAGIYLEAVIDEKTKTVYIAQSGQSANGEANALSLAIENLFARIRRTRPDLTIVSPME